MSPNPIPEVPCQKWLTTLVSVSLDHHDVETSPRIQKRRDDPDDVRVENKNNTVSHKSFPPFKYVSHNLKGKKTPLIKGTPETQLLHLRKLIT